eukprot:1425411-Amphidinium_carterae.1
MVERNNEEDFRPTKVLLHDGCMYILDRNDYDEDCVWQWALGTACGRVLAGPGSTLNGVNNFGEISDIAIDAAGDLYILENGDENIGRVVR